MRPDPFLRACNWSPDAQCCSFCGDDSHRGEAGACTAIFLHAMPVAATGRWQKSINSSAVTSG